MAPIGHHIRIRLQDNRVILHTAEHQRILARVVLHQGRSDGLLAFSLPDTHLHIEALCGMRAASRLCQRIAASLKQRLSLPVSFVTYPHEPIRNQNHLYNTLRYDLTQHERHGLDAATIREATNLPDLLGFRIVGAYTRENVRRCLPRIRDETLMDWGGLTQIRPKEGPLDALVEATLAATALPSLSGRSTPVVEARCAMVEVMGRGIRPSDAAQVLGVVERSVYLLRHRPADPALVRAIRLQLGLRQAIQNTQSSLIRLK